MKKLKTIILMIFFTTISFGQSSMNTEKSQIKDLIIKSFDEIWSELNSKNIEKYYTKDFLLLENGEVWNNDSISNYLDNAVLKKPIPTRVNSFEFIEVKVLNGMAWVAYKNEAIFTVENKIIRKAHWIESATAILTENGWKLEMLHSTRAKNE
ncbi:DUF4440 domain-containing protein [Lutimonas sp.]|uniref:DUF4440 domain-containing protein n=1 Tax=Lutimonas sp. TaxID=1872403 RepID=UPI003C7444E9